MRTLTGPRVIALAAGVALFTGLGSGLASATPAAINNGDFSSGLTGWTDITHGSGGWQPLDISLPGGGQVTDGLVTVPQRLGSNAAAATWQYGPGDHVLYQDVVAHGQLAFDYYWNNLAGRFSTPATLDSGTVPNQQARLDVIKTSADPGTMAPSDILATGVATTADSPASTGWTHAVVDLSSVIGQTVRLRLAEVDNLGYFTFAVTNLSMAPLTTAAQAVSESVHGGDLGFASAPGAVTPPATTLTGKDLMTGAFSLPLNVSDATGSGNGWSVSLNATRFASGDHTLGALFQTAEGTPVCDRAATCTVSTDVNHLVDTVEPLVYGATRLIQTADASAGMGNQTMSPTFDLAVPANSYAGTYTSTWTVSIASAPLG